ncbi:hypothetical protein F503_07896 [Ophiostoma piceae UAMH 11346]|uniref:Uncharacterized protein n=1 Tax=Ophiostoma piceae (strain UAMH 11346) TaxID=1262450 RepID=S3D1X7_OPHP1|nr:hypothetical protein F503_07896 [Ophiostoma piceae UAMH 11346]
MLAGPGHFHFPPFLVWEYVIVLRAALFWPPKADQGPIRSRFFLARYKNRLLPALPSTTAISSSFFILAVICQVLPRLVFVSAAPHAPLPSFSSPGETAPPSPVIPQIAKLAGPNAVRLTLSRSLLGPKFWVYSGVNKKPP